MINFQLTGHKKNCLQASYPNPRILPYIHALTHTESATIDL